MAASDVPALLTGESGTGKERFARAIHGESKRHKQPFVSVNCGTMSEFVESILFGNEETAPARGELRAQGKIREANGGTLFLDDIHALPAAVQVRLLHLLQHQHIEPLKGGRASKVNIRLISASERDLLREVQAGRFREDLYFRLNILPIALPPLRERKQDILPLCDYLIEKIAITDSLSMKPLTEDAKDYVMRQNWPANVRELEALLHRALVYSEQEAIDRDLLVMLHESASAAQPADRRKAPELHVNLKYAKGDMKPMEQIERDAMQAVLDHVQGNVTRAADLLGMAKSTFYRKIKDV